MKGCVGLGTTTVSKQSVQDRYVKAITAVQTAVTRRATGMQGYEHRPHNLSGSKLLCKPLSHQVTGKIIFHHFIEKSQQLTVKTAERCTYTKSNVTYNPD